jgi:hypothetical protein
MLHCINLSRIFKEKMMMEANQMTKQLLDFQKGVFSSWYGAAAIMQDQVAMTVDAMLTQTSWIPVPDQWSQDLLRWASACKKEGDRFKGYMEESLAVLEKCLVPEFKASPAKPQKPPVEQKKPAPVQAQKAAVEEKKAAPAKAQKPAAEQIEAAPVQETKKVTQ